MANNKKIMADLDKVGRILSRAKNMGRRLSPKAASECRSTLKQATKELFNLKKAVVKDSNSNLQKRAALNKSVKESLIDKKDAALESSKISKISVNTKIREKRIEASIDAIKRLASEVHKLSGKVMATKKVTKVSSSDPKMKKRIAERLENIRKAKKEKEAASTNNEKLDKGHETSNQIKEPAKETLKAPEDSTPQNVGVDNSGKGNEAELNHQKHMEGTVPAKMSAKKARAKRLYLEAINIEKKAAKETDAFKKSEMTKRAAMIEKMADQLVASDTSKAKKSVKKPVKATNKRSTKSSKKTASAEKEATTITFSAKDSVLLPDGVVGTISAINGDKLTVSVAGVDKEVMADSAKKITQACPSKAKAKEEDKIEKKMSIADKVKAAAEFMRTGGKKKTAQEEIPLAVADDAPEETQEMAMESTGETVSKTDAQVVNYIDGVGWTVNKSENEVINFGEDKAAAESFVKTEAKKIAEKQDSVIDSANVSKPGSQEDTVKNLKGLDQTGKDYGRTTKDEMVNPQTSMVGMAGKDVKATAMTSDSPVDSATTKRPNSSTDSQKTLKGLDQSGKGYGNTSSDEKINPQLSVYAKRNRILAETNKKQAQRLAKVEAQMLVDRAVKVGTISEGQRSDQEQVLAELYTSSPSEFNAYERLIATMEASAPAKKSVVSRNLNKVKASLENKHSVLTDITAGSALASLDSGNFFDED